MRVISRDAAIAKGLKVYFTGKPCKNDHVCERNTIHGSCVTCIKEIMWRKNNSPAGRARKKRYQYSPKGQEAEKRKRVSPKGRESMRRFRRTAKSIECRVRENERARERGWPHWRDTHKEQRNRRDRERLLEQARVTALAPGATEAEAERYRRLVALAIIREAE